MKSIVIIGAGRLGTALGRSLAEAGLPVKAVADANPAAARRLGRLFPGCRITVHNADAARLGRTIFLCVPDSVLAPVADELARSGIDWRGRIVVHGSGLLDSRILDPLRRRGARTASSHPARSFPAKPLAPGAFGGIPVAVEGQARAASAVRRLLVRLGAKPFSLRAELKPLYHTACALASNDLVVLLDMSLELLRSAGFSERKAWEVLQPLIQGTLHSVKKIGTAAALTGPLVRGDVSTVDRHLDVLKRFPRTREAHLRLSLRALDLLKKTSVRPGAIRAWKRRLERK